MWHRSTDRVNMIQNEPTGGSELMHSVMANAGILMRNELVDAGEKVLDSKHCELTKSEHFGRRLR